MYPRRLVPPLDRTDDLLSPELAELAEKLDSEESVEKLRSGDGHDEMAGVGEMDGDGDPARTMSTGSMVFCRSYSYQVYYDCIDGSSTSNVSKVRAQNWQVGWIWLINKSRELIN